MTIAIALAMAMSIEQRLWLEASTLSNRGEMRQHLPTDNELHLLPLAGSQYQTKQMTWYYLIDPQVMSKAQLATRNRH